MNERGTLMFQALAVMAIMAMTAPFLYRQKAREIKATENRTIEEQTFRIQRAVDSYIQASADEMTANFSARSITQTTFEISDALLRPYLPDTYFEYNRIRPNRLIESYRISAEARCVEAIDSRGKKCDSTALTAACRCVRYFFHAEVIPQKNN